MEEVQINETFAMLDTHSAWKDSMSRMQDAYNASPQEISTSSSMQAIRRHLYYLEARGEEDKARNAVMAELATNPDILPLPYLLGAIAAFRATKNPKLDKNLGGGRHILVGMDEIFRGRGNSYGLASNEAQQLRPSSNVATRAVQIGDELLRLSGMFGKKQTVPVVMVWHRDYTPPRVSYSEVVTGTVTQGAFNLKPPVISSGRVEHRIPTRLTKVTKGEVITKDEYMQDEAKYANIPITSLAGLLHENDRDEKPYDPDVVYIGNDDVTKRVDQALRENKERKDLSDRQRAHHDADSGHSRFR